MLDQRRLVSRQRPPGFVLVHERQQGLGERVQVPLADVRLAMERVTPPTVGMVADEARVVVIQKAERPIVQGQPQNRHVVGVHDAVGKSDRLPLGHELRRANHHLREEARVAIVSVLKMGEVLVNHVVR